MTIRREFLAAGGACLCVLGAPLAGLAQPQPAKVRRIGFLGLTSAAGMASRLDAFRAGLRELGYVEGRNLVVEYRWAEEKYDRLPGLAAELVRLNVDVIVTHGPQGSLAAKQATATIPVVFAIVGDPIASGLVASLAQPGGNITGMTYFGPEINTKRLELLKETFPRIRRVAFLYNPSSGGATLRAMEAAAASLKLDLRKFGVRDPGEFDGAFAAMSKQRIEAVAILEDSIITANLAALAGLASRHRIPLIGFVEVAEAGGLMAYGVNIPAMYRRAAVYADKILKGAKPGDLPIERATNFEFVVNQKTAKALGVTVPQSVLMRADKVIE